MKICRHIVTHTHTHTHINKVRLRGLTLHMAVARGTFTEGACQYAIDMANEYTMRAHIQPHIHMRIYYITFSCAASTHSHALPAAADDFFCFAAARGAMPEGVCQVRLCF
jgi:hypothetical protein